MSSTVRGRDRDYRRVFATVALGACSLLWAGVANAQDAAALAARRSLIEQAQQARRQGDRARALDLAERATQISMSPSLRLFIAQEQSALGRLADAFGNADLCGREAERDVAMRNREVVLGSCRALLAELRTRIGHLEVTVPSPAPDGIRVTVGGNAFASTFWSVPYVVNPGRLIVEATAPGRASFRREIEVSAGGTERVTVELGSAAPGGDGMGSSGPSAGSDGAQPSDPSDRPVRRGPGAGAWILTGVGVASLGAGGLFLGLRQMELAACPNLACPTQATITGVYGYTVGMLAAAGVGVATLTAGIVMLATGGRAPSPSQRPSASLSVVPFPGGAMLHVWGSL